MKRKWNLTLRLFALLLALVFSLSSCVFTAQNGGDGGSADAGTPSEASIVAFGTEIPAYAGKPFYVINQNEPFFTQEEITAECFEQYSELDALGRCGVVIACCGKETMPPEGDKRGEIGHVKPTGWMQNEYDADLVDGGWLYNRSHLIGWQLTDEDDNVKNLITGTRYFNVEGMLPFENMVAAYIRETGNHVMYRVTPLFLDNELVARGVLMEAYSVEDAGEELSFCVFCYNVQPGIAIHYRTGENAIDNGYTAFPDEEEQGSTDADNEQTERYIINKNNKKIHKASCSYAQSIKPENREEHTGEIDSLFASGYSTCGSCFK